MPTFVFFKKNIYIFMFMSHCKIFFQTKMIKKKITMVQNNVNIFF
jgi:hypothetical protein